MRIIGSNKANLNLYNDQLQKQTSQKIDKQRTDQLEISKQAKQLQQGKEVDTKRASYVESIKTAVNSGTYEINYEKTAQKMIDYWSK